MIRLRLIPVLASLTALAACGGDETGPDPNALTCNIPTDQLFSGAADRNSIPALDRPQVAPANASFMRDDDRIVGVEVNGEARAYPFGIMWWHEVANDTLGGDPILVTYCPLTGSGIAFDRRVGGVQRIFGVSGLLYRTNLIMIDQETESLWNQMSLSANCGPDRGLDLPRLAVMETDWGHWKALHPNTTVVTPNTGFDNRPYFSYPYGNYDDPNNDRVDFLPAGTTWSNELLTKELVLGVFDGAAANAYSLQRMADQGAATAVNDELGATPLLVTYLTDGNTATAFDRRVAGQTLTFSVTGTSPFRMTDAETDSEWDVHGEAISGSLQGERLTPLTNAFVAFWFAWSLYFPEIEVAI